MSQTSTAYEVLRRAILDCDLAPDTSLTISALKTKFGFGWTPLREALSRLEAEQLVRMQPNKGYRVSPASVNGLKDLQVARNAIETTLLLRSIERGDDAWEANIVATHHLLSQAPAPTPGAITKAGLIWEKRHNAFHASLLAAAEAPWLEHLCRQTGDQLHRHHRYILNGPDVAQRLKSTDKTRVIQVFEKTLGISHHTKLMDAALARDKTAADSLLSEHIGFSLAVYETLWPGGDI